MLRKIFPKSELFIVDFSSQLYLDNFLISAISAIIAIRIYLASTGYPQIGSDSIHIAHMLWGGFLMMITVIGLLAFINKHIKVWGSIIGGIGFGIFIDELGKFITHDNNYFFQPTFAFIYVLFLLIYFSFRKLFELIERDDKEFVMNALEILKEAVFYDLDENEKNKLKKYLQHSDQGHPLVKQMKELISNIEANPVNTTRLMNRLKLKLNRAYTNIIKSKHFVKFLFALLIFGSLVNVYLVILNLLPLRLGMWEIGLILSVTVATIFVVLGIVRAAEGKSKDSYKSLRTATMTSVLFVQFFAFYFHQLNALIPLVTSFIAYLGIQSLIEEKFTKAKTK